MAQTFRSLSSLLIVMACCFLNGATAEEREGKQILLPAVPPYPFYFYANNPVAPVYVNAGEAPVEMDARVTSSDAVGRTFFRIFGCPTCPTCPAPVTCPTCPTPATPADGAIFIPSTTGCTTAALAATLCTRASAAPKGTIDVTFAASTSVLIGIVGATPTTAIKLTCTSFPTTFTSTTQFGAVAPATQTITGVGFVQFLASSVADVTSPSLKCTWSS
ncbi:hypothetical protein DAPPUDRAFT_253689 [Daphnia pulex]|uniref:Uncharacterized protein n=1 Tax=Daphnia pulex TaxID=6669 RepID=E9H5M4_DAPPU|nr:hypothetical protein DAPPUDRAFT_253689 [Daphnia pulex]|eukprot:EFX72890.1 hypothetical protein DAPPUDRAFT_253689 [Daphnia pulex]